MAWGKESRQESMAVGQASGERCEKDWKESIAWHKKSWKGNREERQVRS